MVVQLAPISNVSIYLIDEALNWNNHISLLKSKLAKVASVKYKVIDYMDKPSIHTLYCSLLLQYCSEIWGNTYTKNYKH